MKKIYKFLIGFGIVILLVIIGSIVAFKSMEKGLSDLLTVPIEEIDLSAVEDGSYTGSFTRMPISVKVQVTVENHDITAIEIIEHVSGQGQPAEVIIDEIVVKDSVIIDAVAGATYSSKCILLAVKNAVNP
mgnify:CR=1 FL=1